MNYKTVLFVCGGNYFRSQVAEAFLNRAIEDRGLSEVYRAVSAGIKVGHEGEALSGVVVDVMREFGYDLSKQSRKQLTPSIVEGTDIVVSMVDLAELPDYLRNLSSLRYWSVKDPRYESSESQRMIRDQIKGLVEELVFELD
jgi:protein-tyrosine-phosphatase